MTTRAEVILEARSWIGTPEQHQQSLKGVACDCIGLVRGVGRSLGMPEAIAFDNDARFKGYSRPPNPRVLLEACAIYLENIPIEDLLPGDVVLGRIENDPQHFGIISAIDPAYIIHADAKNKKVVENGVNSEWRSKILRAYRYRGIEP